MREEQPTSSGDAFLRAVAAFFRFLVRLLFVLVVGLLVGGGLYYGAPWAYRTLVQPVQENSVRLAALEQRIDQQQSHLQEENRALQERIAALETELTQLGEDAVVQVQDQQALTERTQQLEDQATQIETYLEAQQQDANKTRSDLEKAIADLSLQVENAKGQVDETQGRMNDLDGRLMLLQTAQDLLKVRLLLLEESPTVARETLALAVAHLERASELMPTQAETLDGLRGRMVALDDLIASRSFRVRPDLEALWADLMDLVMPLAPQPAVAPTPGPTPVPTPTPTP